MVSEFKDRKAKVLQWDTGDYDGPVTLVLTNAADLSDVSSTELVSNPGYAAVTYPLDYVGATKVDVLDSEGNSLDSGEVDVN